jgi:YbgC/YbaW family acyl-CoA thioester hydrolase
MSNDVFRWETRVLFKDIDFYGVVYYLKYLDWCAQAREHFILEHFPDELGRICPAVIEVKHTFQHPAKLNDAILVEARFQEVKRTSVQMHFRIYRREQEAKELIGIQEQRVLFLSREGKIVKMSPELYAIVKKYERLDGRHPPDNRYNVSQYISV